MVEELGSIASDFTTAEENLKPKLLNIKAAIHSEHEAFIDAFISLDGLSKAVQILRHPKVPLVEAALSIIHRLLGSESTIEYMKKKPDLFTNIYEKMDSQQQRVRYQTLMIFVWLCQNISQNSFQIIMKAATNMARRNNKSPFVELIQSLNKVWDTELRFFALLLINQLIVKAPSEKTLAKFLARLENLGLYDELRSLAQEKSHQGIIKQLQNF